MEIKSTKKKLDRIIRGQESHGTIGTKSYM